MINALKTELVSILSDCGISAFPAFPNAEVDRRQDALTAVEVKKAKLLPAAFGNYLGDSEDGEEFGLRCDAVFGLSVFTSPRLGSDGCNKAVDELIAALMQNGRLELSVTAPEFDKRAAMLRCDCELQAKVWLLNKREAQGSEFGKFIVKGMVFNGDE